MDISSRSRFAATRLLGLAAAAVVLGLLAWQQVQISDLRDELTKPAVDTLGSQFQSLEAEVDQLEVRLAATEARPTSATEIEALRAELAALRGRVETLEKRPAPSTTSSNTAGSGVTVEQYEFLRKKVRELINACYSQRGTNCPSKF